MKLSRRRFLQVGLAGVAVLAVARLLEKPRPNASLVGALVPVVLAGSLPGTSPQREAATREVVEAFDRAVSGLAPAIQDEIDQLFGLLRFAPARFAFTGIRVPLEEAAPAQIAAFLERWRSSRFDLLRAGYQALTQLILAAWYGNAASWPAIGYPGPPSLAPRS